MSGSVIIRDFYLRPTFLMVSQQTAGSEKYGAK
jgi:hypothetical protein